MEKAAPAERKRFSAAARRRLTGWFRANARDLPWRRTSDPYAILVSELMAQQTQVSTVVDAYGRWMDRFPTAARLAAAEETEVLGLWQGLGYYSRARNLHRAAKAIVERHGGEVPPDLPALEALPGVGAYTAGAVMAFAFDRPAAVVDTNVARVLSRVFDLREPIDTTSGRRAVRDAALSLQEEAGGRELNGALMELGALVCKPRNPCCLSCPVRGACAAKDPESLPVKRPRPAVTRTTERRAFVEADGCVYLAQSTGRWRGMWILPETEADDVPAHVENYPITRFLVRMEVVLRTPVEMPGLTPFPAPGLESLPVPSPHRRVIRALAGAAAAGHRGA